MTKPIHPIHRFKAQHSHFYKQIDELTATCENCLHLRLSGCPRKFQEPELPELWQFPEPNSESCPSFRSNWFTQKKINEMIQRMSTLSARTNALYASHPFGKPHLYRRETFWWCRDDRRQLRDTSPRAAFQHFAERYL